MESFIIISQCKSLTFSPLLAGKILMLIVLISPLCPTHAFFFLVQNVGQVVSITLFWLLFFSGTGSLHKAFPFCEN